MKAMCILVYTFSCLNEAIISLIFTQIIDNCQCNIVQVTLIHEIFVLPEQTQQILDPFGLGKALKKEQTGAFG